MIYLYDSTETDFRYNGKPLPASYDVTVSNTLNSEYYVMGKYPLDKDKVYKEIVEDRIIKVHTMDGMEPFRIVNVSKHELYVEFEAWPLFYADMRNKLVRPLNLKGVSGQTALNSFKNNLLIDTPFDFYSDITDNHDYHTQDENERENNPKQLYNALDVFKTIVNRWGGELWIRGYDIRVNKRIGTDTEAMLYEKKNITEFVDTTNIEGIVTRLHGKSEWQDERQEGEEEGQKHSIEVTVDSPLINNYSGVIFEKQFTNNDIRTEQELKNWLNLKFTTENIDKPQRTIEVGTNVIDGTKIGFADTLILKYIKHDTDVRIKVVGYEYDGFANELKHVVLGQPKHTSSSTIGNTITDLVNNVVEPVDRKTTIAMNSADGKSTVFHGTADPNTLNLNAKENDAYFRTNGSEKEIWRFTGTLWELIMDTSDTAKNAGAIAAQQQDIEDARQVADEAVEQIDTAVANAGFTSLDDTLQNMNYITMNAEQNAQQAITNASNAYGLAQTSISEAQTAQANSLTALGKADNALDGVSSLNVRVDDVEAELELKADNTFMNEDGTLTTLSNAITFNAHRFSSDMSRIESRVESLAGEINLVILRDAFEDRRIEANTVYPNVSFVDTGHNTMRELITVTGGEKIALSKEATTPITNDTNWRVIYYDSQMGIISRPMTASNEIVLTVPNNATKMWVSWPKGSKPQIIRGSDFLPYRPNMADQMTTDEMVIFRNEYDEYADRTERRLTAIDSEGGSLDVLSNEIITTAERVTTDMTALIDTKVGDDEFTEFYQNEYSETAQEVSRKISLSDINLGGRNLVLNSDNPSELLNKGILGYKSESYVRGPSVALPNGNVGSVLEFGSSESNAGWLRFRPFKFEAGKEYTFSFWARRSTAGASLKLGIGINSEGNSSTQSKEVDISTTWQRFVFTAKISRDVNVYNFVELRPPRFTWDEYARYYIWRPQLERANVSSDWEEAPEDSDTRINHIQTEWTQTFDSFEQTITGEGGINTQLQTLENSLSAINDPVTGRLTIAEQNINGFKDEVYNSDGTSKITQLATGVQSLVTNLSELEVGGRNLIKNSDYKNGLPERETYNASVSILNIFDPYGAISPVMRLVPSADAHYFRFRRVIPRNETTYTFSAWMRRTNGTDYGVSVRIGTERDGETVVVGDTWKKVKVTGKATRGTDTYHFVEIDTNNQWVTIDIFEPMFEYGTLASTHQIAPEDTQSQISQLATNINLRVTKGELLSQINIEAGRTLIQSDKLLLNATNTVITGTAWMDGAVIANASIDGAKIQDATIGSAKIANLDAAKITTGILDGIIIRSQFDYAYDGAIRNQGTTTVKDGAISSIGTFTHSYGSTYMNITPDRIYAENLMADRSVRSQFILDGRGITVATLGETAYYRQDGISFPQGDAIVRYYDTTARIEMGSYNGVTLSAVNKSDGGLLTRLSVGGGNDGIDPFVDIYTRMNMRFNNIDNVSRIDLRNPTAVLSGSMVANTSDNWLHLGGRWGTRVGHMSENHVDFHPRAEFGASGDIKFFANLNMQNNTIINNSDERLKRDIKPTEINSLAAVESWGFVGFNWIDGEMNERNGRQLGVIAQDTPDLAMYNAETDTWSINSSKQIMMNSHAIQQLALRERNTNLVASQALEATESNESKIHKLQQELSKANRRIEELEGVI